MKEGNGNVLDQSIILFGSNMANSDLHNNNPLPQALIGQGGGVKGDQHLRYPAGHAAREHPGDDGAARGRPDAGLREVRRHHRRLRRSVIVNVPSSLADRRLRCWRPPRSQKHRPRNLAPRRPPWAGSGEARRQASRRRPPTKTSTPQRRRQHAAAVGGLRGRCRRGEAADPRRRRREAANNYGVTR